MGINTYDVVAAHSTGEVQVWLARSDMSFSRSDSVARLEELGPAAAMAVSPSAACITALIRRGQEGVVLRMTLPGQIDTREVVVPPDAGNFRAVCLSPCGWRAAGSTTNSFLPSPQHHPRSPTPSSHVQNKPTERAQDHVQRRQPSSFFFSSALGAYGCPGRGPVPRPSRTIDRARTPRRLT